MIPDYQTLMRPVLECAASGEVRIGDVVEQLANKFGLTAEERGRLAEWQADAVRQSRQLGEELLKTGWSRGNHRTRSLQHYRPGTCRPG